MAPEGLCSVGARVIDNLANNGISAVALTVAT
jgi:hypothetical protein